MRKPLFVMALYKGEDQLSNAHSLYSLLRSNLFFFFIKHYKPLVTSFYSLEGSELCLTWLDIPNTGFSYLAMI